VKIKIEVVQKIAPGPRNAQDRPLQEIKMLRMEVLEDPA